MIRRLLQVVPVFFGATFLIFALVYAVPGDPIDALVGDRPLEPGVRAELRHRYHLDDPLLVRYGKYLSGLAHGDFGTNFRGRPVSEIMKQRFPVTIRLGALAFAFETVVGLAAGVVAGLRRRSLVDSLVLVSTTIVVAIPVFVLGYCAQLLLGVKLGWFPVVGIREGWRSYFLPAMVLGSLSLCYVARLARASLVEAMRADYVRTARAKGLPERRVVGVHALRNSLIPVVTFLGVDLGSLMAGAIVTEGIFNVPGIGQATFTAIHTQEYATVVGIVTALVLIFMLANLLVDVLYAVLDPQDPVSLMAITEGSAVEVAAETPVREAGLWSDAWRQLRRNPMFLLPAAIIVLFTVMAVAPGLFTRADPRACDLSHSLLRPSGGHWFGYDLQGCDYYARVIHGARVSMTIGITTVIGTAVVAVVLGTLAGFYGGIIDTLIARMTDVWFALPTLLGAVVLLSVLGSKGLPQLTLVLVVFGWPTMTRLMRSAVLTVRDMEYVTAARALGAGDLRLMWRHILPNALTPVIVYGAIRVGIVIAAEATLSFLGLGLQLPSISWGLMIASAQPRLLTAPHLLLFPGLFLSVTVLAFVLLGDAVRDAFDPPAPMTAPVLSVRDLRVEFPTADGVVSAVNGVDFDLVAGETLAILGESGSGKSVTAQAVMGLIERPGRVAAGSVAFAGLDLLAASAEDRRQVRGSGLAMVFQDPLSALNPVWSVGFQIAEMFRVHRGMFGRDARRRAVELLERVRIPAAAQRVGEYPHQFSGGMRQRVMIAMALALDPKVLIADEPTTALDVTVQAQILELLDDLRAETGMGLLLITHDLGVVGETADRVAVMYAGRIVETGPTDAVLSAPSHPYTEGLLASVPRGQSGREERLRPITGAPPSLARIPAGCPFHPRCPYVVDQCRNERPPLVPVGAAAAGSVVRAAACWRSEEVGRDQD